MVWFDFGRARRAVLSPTWIPAVLAGLVIVALGLVVDRQNQVVHDQQLRAEVATKLNVIRAKLEGNVNANIQLVRGLVATLTTEPKMDQARFGALAQNLFQNDSQLRNIAGAPGLVVSLVYPVAGNQKVLGFDYRKSPEQGEAALRARDTGQLVLAGPVELRQGGRGFIGRFPVFIGEQDGDRRFWGIVSAVIDAERLYRDSGLEDAEGIEVALVGVDGSGESGAQFFGLPELLTNSPVTAEVRLPAGRWMIAAVPEGGWAKTPGNAWLMRVLILCAGVLVVVPMALASRFYRDRTSSYRALLRSEAALRSASRRLALALEASAFGVWEVNLETGETRWDDRLHAIYGRKPDGSAKTYEDWISIVHPDDVDRAKVEFEQASNGERPYSSQYRIVWPNGEVRDIRSRAVVARDARDTPQMIGVEWDVTEDVRRNRDLERAKTLAETRSEALEAAKSRIEFNAMHDPLTGLPNRRYLDERLSALAGRAERSGNGLALLHIDLDRFKHINDTLGHAAGDAMLVHAARVLTSSVRAHDFVARIGGDEFVVVCELDEQASHLEEMANRIICEMRVPVPYEGHECRFGVSIGIATDTGRRMDGRKLMINADLALYRAKRRGRNRYDFFNDTLQAEISRTKRVADDILVGLERGEFVPFFQPQFDARTHRIIGAEALVRWRHPSDGLLTPDAFLKTAEELNVASAIDRQVLEQTLKHFRDWNRHAQRVPHVSVNVSAGRLRDDDLIAGLRRLDLPRGALSFELVESILMDDSEDALVWNVDSIKELGIDIEIDDFGTGYASIVSLLKLKPRRLKIDRQFVSPVVNSVRQRAVVQSLVDIGKTLGIEVIAEGVETMEHARVLKEVGCDILQGYAFGRPMSAEDFARFLDERRLREAS